jgi:hypothetical protein
MSCGCKYLLKTMVALKNPTNFKFHFFWEVVGLAIQASTNIQLDMIQPLVFILFESNPSLG